MPDRAPYELTDFRSSALDGLLAALRVTHANGAVLFAQVQAAGVEERDRWFAVGSSIYRTNDVFAELFDSAAARDALPELMIPKPWPLTNPPQFDESPTGTLTLAGELASALVHGGAYIRFDGPAADALNLAQTGLADLVGDRHEHFRVFESFASWTPWFFDVAWDQTWILADYERHQVSIICKTDTD